MAVYQNEGKSWHFKRYPETTNRSLRSWSAADELLMSHFEALRQQPDFSPADFGLVLYHDRFGFLSTVLHSWKPLCVVNYSSQDKAMRQNLTQNNLPLEDSRWINPLQVSDEASVPALALMKVPKSLELFELYLRHAWLLSKGNPDFQVFAGFMTRHFTPQMLKISARYFEHAEQSLAVKKARVLKLKGPKPAEPELSEDAGMEALLKEISWKLPAHLVQDKESIPLKQYYGVFSADAVDEATALLIAHLELKESDRTILDLACGNGVIAKAVTLLPSADREVHALDDDFLACASARLNLGEAAMVHHYDGLDMFPSDFFDVILTNPPAHLEHENNIEVSLSLFKQASKKLKSGGSLWVVAGTHLNYSTHLQQWFSCEVKAQTGGFELLVCTKK
ncbi:23S rRNA (guanine1835-N2)-methyltransferase [Cyclonatronum proteinivorum]|uniref:23S rRNA (Guanine1835-N2)-methyltransferase n=1 Tax=Cyclonatronum proteinivorum TaxID=1457365 RepID=A0A345UG82_9BACT|nr:methyltransferase [Cyclonatronum proteinivorum]AXI99483.1 23S rRNA (guanine1835-N2)-methyltransferase [Cyclonatronum proteinivorum]